MDQWVSDSFYSYFPGYTNEYQKRQETLRNQQRENQQNFIKHQVIKYKKMYYNKQIYMYMLYSSFKKLLFFLSRSIYGKLFLIFFFFFAN